MCELSRDDRRQWMDPALMERIVDEASRFRLRPKLHFSGKGEPLIHPEIRRVMRRCGERRLGWSLTTNGYFLDTHAEDLVRNGCRAVNLSIHGDEAEHDRITGVGTSFRKTMEGVERLNERKRRLGRKPPLVAVNCVITNQNVGSLDAVLRALVDLPVDSVTLQHLVFTEQELRERAEFLILVRGVLAGLRRFLESVERGGFPVRVNVFPRLRGEDLAG